MSTDWSTRTCKMSLVRLSPVSVVVKSLIRLRLLARLTVAACSRIKTVKPRMTMASATEVIG